MNTDKEVVLAEEEKAAKHDTLRTTPKTGAEQSAVSRDRRIEKPAGAVSEKMQERLKAANETANQTIDEGNPHEVQGKAAVPHVKVMKRGSTKWTDKDGVVHKELNDEEVNAELEDEELPDYLKLHQEVLDGADPIEATLKYQGNEEESFAEGKLADAEKHPRTAGLGRAATAENVQKDEKNDR